LGGEERSQAKAITYNLVKCRAFSSPSFTDYRRGWKRRRLALGIEAVSVLETRITACRARKCRHYLEVWDGVAITALPFIR